MATTTNNSIKVKAFALLSTVAFLLGGFTLGQQFSQIRGQDNIRGPGLILTAACPDQSEFLT